MSPPSRSQVGERSPTPEPQPRNGWPKSLLIYGEPIAVGDLDCVGSRVQITVETGYFYRSTLRVLRDRQYIEATGAAEAYLVLPGDTPSELKYLGECPL